MNSKNVWDVLLLGLTIVLIGLVRSWVAGDTTKMAAPNAGLNSSWSKIDAKSTTAPNMPMIHVCSVECKLTYSVGSVTLRIQDALSTTPKANVNNV